MRIRVWKGFHSEEIKQLVEETWRSDEQLLILTPPGVNASEFLPAVEKMREWPDRPVLGLFTSGTTVGETKLILYSKANIRASLNGILKFFEIERIDSIFCYPQPFHTFGLLLGYVLSLEQGWELFTGEGKYSTAFHSARASVDKPGLLTLGTPTHFKDLLNHLKQPLAPSYSCIIGGAKVSVKLWHQLKSELKIEAPSIGYGATEASPGISHLTAGRAPIADGEIGFPLDGLKIRFEAGKGYEFSGPSVCMAIVSRDGVDFPRSIFISDDLVVRDDGSLIFQGRSDLVLNRGGEKFSLEAIENCLTDELNAEVMAVAIPDKRLGHELGLLVSAPFEKQAVLKLLKVKFGANFNPELFRTVHKLPMNSSFKPDRKRGRAAFGESARS